MSKFIAPGIIFLLTLASGAWLSRSGKPLNTAIFTVHKLIATGALMSMNQPAYNMLLTIHAIAPFVAVIAMALAVYLLTGSAS